jgi:hypothetical protein
MRTVFTALKWLGDLVIRPKAAPGVVLLHWD